MKWTKSKAQLFGFMVMSNICLSKTNCNRCHYHKNSDMGCRFCTSCLSGLYDTPLRTICQTDDGCCNCSFKDLDLINSDIGAYMSCSISNMFYKMRGI